MTAVTIHININRLHYICSVKWNSHFHSNNPNSTKVFSLRFCIHDASTTFLTIAVVLCVIGVHILAVKKYSAVILHFEFIGIKRWCNAFRYAIDCFYFHTSRNFAKRPSPAAEGARTHLAGTARRPIRPADFKRQHKGGDQRVILIFAVALLQQGCYE